MVLFTGFRACFDLEIRSSLWAGSELDDVVDALPAPLHIPSLRPGIDPRSLAGNGNCSVHYLALRTGIIPGRVQRPYPRQNTLLKNRIGNGSSGKLFCLRLPHEVPLDIRKLVPVFLS